MNKNIKSRFTWITGQVKLVVGVATGVVIGGAGSAVVMAAIPDASNVIHACYVTSTGAIRLIDDSTQQCRGSETAITWNQAGPQGLQGIQGPVGPQGPAGPAGASEVGDFLPDLTNRQIYSPGMSNRNFSGADLHGSSFTSGSVYGSDLRSANLSGATWFSMQMFGVLAQGANFSDSHLTNVGFIDSNLQGANFSNATLSDTMWFNTICPDGTNSDANGGTCLGHLAL